MKIAYRGHLYEENYHFSKIGYFNKDFHQKVDETVNELMPQVMKFLHSPVEYLPKKLQVSNQTLPKIYIHNKAEDDSEASVQSYDPDIKKIEDKENKRINVVGGDGKIIVFYDKKTKSTYNKNGEFVGEGDVTGKYIPILLRFNDYYLSNQVNEEKIKVILSHEVAHIYQFALGIYDPTDITPKKKTDDKYFKYFNDPKEINAFLNSVVSYVRQNKEGRESLKKMSLDAFFKSAFNIMGQDEELMKQYMEENAIITFYEGLILLRAKIKQGEYD